MTQNPAQLDIVIYKGDDFNPNWSLATACGTPIDLAGASVSVNMWTQVGYPEPFVSLTTDNGGVTLEEKDGVISVILPFIAGEDTAEINETCGFYHMDITFASGAINRYLQGGVSVVR